MSISKKFVRFVPMNVHGTAYGKVHSLAPSICMAVFLARHVATNRLTTKSSKRLPHHRLVQHRKYWDLY